MLDVDGFKEVISESSSKGKQLKFYKDGYWVKIDNSNCYEGLAEDFVSKFESCIYEFPFVDYKSDIILYNDEENNGCLSYNMYNRLYTTFISFKKLLRQNGIPQNIFIASQDIKENIENVRRFAYNTVGLDLLDYFRRLLLLDCLIINEDRHIMNIGVVYCDKDNKYYETPCFDNGSSLFCTNWTYRKRKSLEENIEFAKTVARPFSTFYDKQLDALLSLGCKPLVIDKKRVEILLENYYNKLYSEELNNRIKDVLKNRLNYYYGKAFRWG